MKTVVERIRSPFVAVRHSGAAVNSHLCYLGRMRGWPFLLLAACTDGPVTGHATSSAHPEARSAVTFVDNVGLGDPPGTYRRWTIEIGDAAEGIDCRSIGAPIIAIEVYTIFDSAPRGQIPLSLTPPPRIFPAAFATVIDGINAQGSVMITSAATTRIAGTLTGYVTIDGAPRALDVTFESPTCSP